MEACTDIEYTIKNVKHFIASYLDREIVLRAPLKALLSDLLNFSLPEKIIITDLDISKEIVLPRYAPEAYPSELQSVQRIYEVLPRAVLSLDFRITAQDLSKITAIGKGVIRIDVNRVDAEGAWVIEVETADPPENEEERGKKLEKILKDYVFPIVVTIFAELIAKAIVN